MRTTTHRQSMMLPPRRGLSLGWRLAISTALIVTAIMGVVTVLQQRHDLDRERSARESLLRESLAPLVYGLSAAPDPEQMKEELTSFCHSFVRAGYRAHQMELRDAGGETIASTRGGSTAGDDVYFKVSVPVSAPVLDGGRGTLTLWDDASEYRESVSERWHSWGVHMAVTLFPILLFLLLAVRIMVARPLEGLLEQVRKMEMGYWDRPPPDKGPWEIRWLGWRFRNLGIELRKTVEELVQAERLASRCSEHEHHPARSIQSGAVVGIDAAPAALLETIDCEGLMRKCDDLISMDVSDPDAVELAREVWQNDAVAAGQAGDMRLKAALEDASLRLLEPAVFRVLQARLADVKTSLASWAEEVKKDLREVLEREKIPCVYIGHRVKHTAGVWRKMKLKHLALDEIDDLFAFRIIVPTEPDCYWTLGKIHEAFKPVVGRFNDYIAFPKANGYQSIHTCVRGPTGPVFEIQIRSVTMHLEAERGTAAHWLYKAQQSVIAPGRPQAGSLLKRLLERIRRRNGKDQEFQAGR